VDTQNIKRFFANVSSMHATSKIEYGARDTEERNDVWCGWEVLGDNQLINTQRQQHRHPCN